MYGLFTGLSVLSGTPLLVRSSSDSALTPQTEIEGSFSQETPVKVRPGRCPEKPSWTKTQPEQTEWWCSPEPPFSHLLHKWRGRAQIHRFGFKRRLTNKMLMSPFLHIFVIWSCGKQPFLMVPAEPGRRISTFCHLFLSINVGFLSFILSDFFLHKVHFPLHVFLKPQSSSLTWSLTWLTLLRVLWTLMLCDCLWWCCCVVFSTDCPSSSNELQTWLASGVQNSVLWRLATGQTPDFSPPGSPQKTPFARFSPLGNSDSHRWSGSLLNTLMRGNHPRRSSNVLCSFPKPNHKQGVSIVSLCIFTHKWK